MTNQLSTQISNINKTCTNGKTKSDNINTNTHKNGKQKKKTVKANVQFKTD